VGMEEREQEITSTVDVSPRIERNMGRAVKLWLWRMEKKDSMSSRYCVTCA
jgi:hypothetical protein